MTHFFSYLVDLCDPMGPAEVRSRLPGLEVASFAVPGPPNVPKTSQNQPVALTMPGNPPVAVGKKMPREEPLDRLEDGDDARAHRVGLHVAERLDFVGFDLEDDFHARALLSGVDVERGVNLKQLKVS